MPGAELEAGDHVSYKAVIIIPETPDRLWGSEDNLTWTNPGSRFDAAGHGSSPLQGRRSTCSATRVRPASDPSSQAFGQSNSDR